MAREILPIPRQCADLQLGKSEHELHASEIRKGNEGRNRDGKENREMTEMLKWENGNW